MEKSRPLCCRSCNTALRHTFVDLGMSPLANSYLNVDHWNAGNVLSASRLRVRSVLSRSTRMHGESSRNIFRLCLLFLLLRELARSRPKLRRKGDRHVRLQPTTLVVEIASNDGYLLHTSLPGYSRIGD